MGSRALTATALVMFASACGQASDDASGAAIDVKPDGGTAGGGSTDASVNYDAAPEDDAAPVTLEGGYEDASDTGFVPEPTSYLVHASPDIFAFRICVQGASGHVTQYPYPDSSDHYLPESNYPGIPVGGVINIDPLVDKIVSELEVTVRLVAADAYDVKLAQPSLPNAPDCAKLVEDGLLGEDEMVELPSLPLDSLLRHAVRTVMVQGCRAGTTVPTSACGQNYDPADGNAGWNVIGFSPTLALEPSTTLVYAAHTSPALSAMQTQGHNLKLAYVAGSTETVIEGNVPTDLQNSVPSQFTAPAELADYDAHHIEVTALGGPADTSLLRASLADIQQVTSPYSDPPALFTTSNGLVLLLVGEGTSTAEPWMLENGSWNGAYDGRGLHAVVLPFQFVYR